MKLNEGEWVGRSCPQGVAPVRPPSRPNVGQRCSSRGDAQPSVTLNPQSPAGLPPAGFSSGQKQPPSPMAVHSWASRYTECRPARPENDDENAATASGSSWPARGEWRGGRETPQPQLSPPQEAPFSRPLAQARGQRHGHGACAAAASVLRPPQSPRRSVPGSQEHRRPGTQGTHPLGRAGTRGGRRPGPPAPRAPR